MMTKLVVLVLLLAQTSTALTAKSSSVRRGNKLFAEPPAAPNVFKLTQGLTDARVKAEEEHERTYGDAAPVKSAFETWKYVPTTTESVEVMSYDFPAEKTKKKELPRPFSSEDLCFRTLEPMFTPEECAAVIEEAESKEWKQQGDYDYAKDVVQQIEDLPKAKKWLTESCRDKLFPLLQQCFDVVPRGEVGRESLRVQDAKILKYNATAGQSYLGVHRDGTLLTLVVALNSLEAYTDGGTYIEDLDGALRYDTGHVIAHPGIVRHGGQRITSGVRYALAIFVDLYGFVDYERIFLSVADRMRVRGLQEKSGTENAELWYAYSLACHDRPNTEQAWIGLGQCYAGSARWTEAIEAYKRATDCEPRSVTAWTNMGSAIVERQRVLASSDVSEAVVAFAKAAKLSETETAPLSNLGLLLQVTGKREEALEIFNAALQRALKDVVPGVTYQDPKLSELYLNLGVAKFDLDDVDGARAAFDAALHFDASNSAALQNLAFLQNEV